MLSWGSSLTCSVVGMLLWVSVGSLVEGVSFEEDVTIPLEQKMAIDKLKSKVLPYITESYMKDDIYLVKWLRVSDFDISLAERKIIDHIKWRKDNRMLTIDQEDFSDIAAEFPYFNTGFDREGKPLFIAFAGEWDIRGAIITGRSKRLFRYLYQAVEMLSRRIIAYQREGRNVTQAVLIIDLGQFNLSQHACVRCLLRIVQALQLYENNRPGIADKLILVNAPPTIQAAVEVARQVMSKESRAALKVFGTNKTQWKEYLLKHIDRKYLPVELGGTIQRD